MKKCFCFLNIILPKFSCGIILFLFFIAGGKFVFSQQNKSVNYRIDSLLVLLKKDKEDTNKIIHLYRISNEYRKTGMYDTAHQYGQLSLQLAKKIDFKRGIAYAYNNIGLIYDDQNYSNEALRNFYSSLRIREEIEDKDGIATSYHNIGLVYFHLSNYSEAMKNYLNSLKIFEECGDKSKIATLYNNIGLIYREQGNYQKSLENHRASLKISKELNDQKHIASSYNNIGVSYSEQGNYTDALQNYLAANQINIKLGDKKAIAMAYNNIGDVYDKQDNYDNALKNYFASLKTYEEIGNNKELANGYNNIGNIYGRTGNYHDGILWLQKGLHFSQKAGAKVLMMDAYKELSDTYSRMNDFKNAFENYLLYSAVKDTLFNEEKSKQQAEMEAKYENEKKEKEILGLQKDNEIKQLALNKNRAQFFALAAGVGIILLIGFLFFQRNRQKHKHALHAEMLLHQEERLRTIIETQEEERKRISKDLHDGVGQLLTGLKLAWQNVSGEISSAQPMLKEKITSSTKVLDEAATEVRSISHQMMPRALQESGMVTAIESMLSKSLSNTGINYEFEHSNIERFTESIEINLYRVTQEMINNILKHSGANQINIQLFKNKNSLVLIIEDNGKGFNFDKQKKEGHGLMNITTRVKSLRGEIHYEPGPEKGTVATVRIPLA